MTTKQVIFEQTYYAQDSGTLEQLRELSSRRKAWEEPRNGSNMAHAIAREIAGGETSPVAQEIGKVEKYLPVGFCILFSLNWFLSQWGSLRLHCAGVRGNQTALLESFWVCLIRMRYAIVNQPKTRTSEITY